MSEMYFDDMIDVIEEMPAMITGLGDFDLSSGPFRPVSDVLILVGSNIVLFIALLPEFPRSECLFQP